MRCRLEDTTKISGIPPQHAILLQLLACLARHPSAFTSTCGTDTAGRGAFESPPEDGARTNLFDREFQFCASHTEAETKTNSWPNPRIKEWSYIDYTFILRPRRKKTPDRIPEKNNDHIYIFILLLLWNTGRRIQTKINPKGTTF